MISWTSKHRDRRTTARREWEQAMDDAMVGYYADELVRYPVNDGTPLTRR